MKALVVAGVLVLAAGVTQAQAQPLSAGRAEFGEVGRLQHTQALACISGLSRDGTVAEMDIPVTAAVPVTASVTWRLGNGGEQLATGELTVASAPSVLHARAPLPADRRRSVTACSATARWGPVTVVPRLAPGQIERGPVSNPVPTPGPIRGGRR